jgi:hypothetical protein
MNKNNVVDNLFHGPDVKMESLANLFPSFSRAGPEAACSGLEHASAR